MTALPPQATGTIAALARRQHGAVTFEQLLDAGLSPDSIERRVHAGRMRRVHRGVYLVGPIEAPHATEMAAVLACGEAAVLSHRSAAALWQLLPYPAQHAPVHITVPRSDRGRLRSGIHVHRVGSLELDETTTCKGIPITTPARTVLDLAADSTERELEQALAQAEARHLTSRRKLLLLLARYPGRRGVRALRRLLERDARPALTRSEAEERFLALIRKSGLPHPDVNVNLGRYEVDFLWREHRLVVEIDGYAHHSDRESFEADRARDAWLAAQGHTVIRVTWRQLVDEPEVVLARVAEALASRRG